MKIERILKSYYQDRLEAFSPRPETKNPLLERARAASERRGFAPRPSLIFHSALIAVLAVMLWANTGTARSLERIDPENRRIRQVEQSLQNGLTAVWTAAAHPASPPDKGGSS